MRTTSSTLVLLLAFAATASAREVRAPDGAWAMTVPDDWQDARPEDYEKMPKSVHRMFGGPPDEDKKRPRLQVSVIERPLYVAKDARDQFRTECASEIQDSNAREAGIQIDIANVDVERIGDRDVYRLEGSRTAKGTPPVKFVKWYVPAGDKQFVFSFDTTATTYPYKVIEFETMSRSIWIREPVPVKPGAGTDWSSVVTFAGIAVAVLCGIAFVIVARKQFKRADPADGPA